MEFNFENPGRRVGPKVGGELISVTYKVSDIYTLVVPK